MFSIYSDRVLMMMDGRWIVIQVRQSKEGGDDTGWEERDWKEVVKWSSLLHLVLTRSNVKCWQREEIRLRPTRWRSEFFALNWREIERTFNEPVMWLVGWFSPGSRTFRAITQVLTLENRAPSKKAFIFKEKRRQTERVYSEEKEQSR